MATGVVGSLAAESRAPYKSVVGLCVWRFVAWPGVNGCYHERFPRQKLKIFRNFGREFPDIFL